MTFYDSKKILSKRQRALDDLHNNEPGMNYYENHADAETSYARFAENGSEVQAMFDASATCEGPNASDSYQFYPDPDDEA